MCNGKTMLAALLLAPMMSFGLSAACANGQVTGIPLGDGHPIRQDWEGLAGPNYQVEDGEEFETRANNFRRYNELERLFSEELAEKVGLNTGLWELLPNIHYFRLLLTQATLQGELACEDNRQCKLEAARMVLPSGHNPLCGNAMWCNRQHSETVSTCNVILTQRCRFPLETICRKYRQEAYELCMKIADCQLDCCMDGCSGTNCASWAVGNSDQPCVNCNMSPM